MANVFPQRLTINAYPAGSTLTTAGAQAALPESGMARMENVLTGMDGVVRRVRGVAHWGQKLMVPSAAADVGIIWRAEDVYGSYSLAFGPDVTDLPKEHYWHMRTETVPSLMLRGRKRLVGETTTSRKVAMRVVYRCNSATTTASFTTPMFALYDPTLAEVYLFGIGSAGLYRDNAGNAVALAGTAAAAHVGWHVLEIRLDCAAKTFTIYLDDALLFSGSGAVATADATAAWFQVGCYSLTAGVSDLYVDSVMYAAGDTSYAAPFDAAVPRQVFSWDIEQNSQQAVQHLIACAGTDVWADDYHQGSWRYVRRIGTSGITRAYKYRDLLILTNDTAVPESWDGHKAFAILGGAPLCSIAVEHQGRLFVAGDPLHPSRVYYTAVNNTQRWNTEETPNPSNAAEAGFFDVPSRQTVTALVGDHYGNLIIFTDRGAGILEAGTDPDTGIYSGAYKPLYGDAGCIGPLAWQAIENDIWYESNRGLHALQTTQRFGDLLTEAVSVSVRDFWAPDSLSNNYLNLPAQATSQLAYNAHEGRIYMPIALATDNIPARVLVFDIGVKGWVGLTTFGGSAAGFAMVSSPARPYVFYGRSDGYIFYYLPEGSTLQNYDGSYSTATIQSLFLTGRSVEEAQRPDLPHFTNKSKTWKELRLSVFPRGEHTVSASVEVNNAEAVDSGAYDLNVYGEAAIDHEFTLDDDYFGITGDFEVPGVVTIPIQTRGQWCRFTITADSINDLNLLGWELDFTPGQIARAGE